MFCDEYVLWDSLSIYYTFQPVSRLVEARRPDHSHSTHVWSVSSEAMVLCRDRDPSSDCFHGSFHPYTTQHPLTSYKPASVKASVCQATFISPRLRCDRTCSYSFNPRARFRVRSAESTGGVLRPNGILSAAFHTEIHPASAVDVNRAAPTLL